VMTSEYRIQIIPVQATANCCGKLICSVGFFMSLMFAMEMPHLKVGAQKNCQEGNHRRGQTWCLCGSVKSNAYYSLWSGRVVPELDEPGPRSSHSLVAGDFFSRATTAVNCATTTRPVARVPNASIAAVR
jgi:hypothetical protein